MTELHHVNEAGDRRTEAASPMRMALLALRIAEFEAAEYLPDDLERELVHAIASVVSLIRKTEAPK